MSFASFGTGGASVDYITREKAAERISFVKLPELRAGTKKEERDNAVAYSELRMEVEKSKRKNARTNYKLLLSWDRKESSEVADRMAAEFVERNFPTAKAILAIHQDTDNTHAHIWIDARGTDGKKLHFKKNEFQMIDERWHKAFDEEYNTDYFVELKAKKTETADYKKAKAEGREAEKPARAADEFSNDYWRGKEIENVTSEKLTGVKRALPQATPLPITENSEDEKIGLGSDQQFIAAKNIEARRTKSGDQSSQPEFRGTEPTVEKIVERVEREQQLAQRIFEPRRSETSIDNRSTKRIDTAGQPDETRESLDYWEYRANETGKRRDDAITNRISSNGSRESSGSDQLSSPGAVEEPRRNQGNQQKFGFDGKKFEGGGDGISRNEGIGVKSQFQFDELYDSDILDSQRAVVPASELKAKEIPDNQLHQNGLGDHSGTGKAHNRIEEEVSGENKQSDFAEQSISTINTINTFGGNHQFEENYFNRLEVITVYNQQTGTFINETVFADEASFRRSAILTSQPEILQNFNLLNSYINPFADQLAANDLSLQSIEAQTNIQNQLAADSSEINQSIQSAFENPRADDLPAASDLAEIMRIHSETENILAQYLTESGEESELPGISLQEETFEISDKIELNYLLAIKSN